MKNYQILVQKVVNKFDLIGIEVRKEKKFVSKLEEVLQNSFS